MTSWSWLPVVRRGSAGGLLDNNALARLGFMNVELAELVLASAAPVTHNLGVCYEH